MFGLNWLNTGARYLTNRPIQEYEHINNTILKDPGFSVN